MPERPTNDSQERDAQERDDASPGEGLSADELAEQTGDALPERLAPSTLDVDMTIPVNPAVAADVLSGLVDDPEEDAQEGDDPEPQ